MYENVSGCLIMSVEDVAILAFSKDLNRKQATYIQNKESAFCIYIFFVYKINLKLFLNNLHTFALMEGSMIMIVAISTISSHVM